MRRNIHNDFDDIIDEDIDYGQVKPKNNYNKKKDLDFYDMEDDFEQSNKVKLPRISAVREDAPVFMQKYVPQFVPKADSKRDIYSVSSKRSDKKAQQIYNFEIEAIKKQPTRVQDSEKQNDAYGDYEDDFEDFQNEVYQQVVSKPQSIKSVHIPEKKVTNNHIPPRGNKSVVSSQKSNRIIKSQTKPAYQTKGKELNKNASIKSFVMNTPVLNSKYSNEVNKQFTQTNLNIKSVDEINKMNQKVRSMIRKMNEQLNNILSKAALDQRAVSKKKPVESVIKVLISEKSNNEKILLRQQGELKKAKGKAGIVKDQDYEVQIDKQIEQCLKKKKQLEKIVEKMNSDINYGHKRAVAGNSNSINKKGVQSVKTQLINFKKQNQRIQNHDKQVTSKLSQIESKCDETQNKHAKLVRQAYNRGISLDAPNIPLEAKHKECLQKQKTLQKHLIYLENVNKTKQSIFQSQNQRIRRTLTALDSQIKDIYSQIVDLGDKSSSLVEKQKQNPKIMKNVINSLQKICQSITDVPEFDKMSRKSLRSKASSLSHKNQRTLQNSPSHQFNNLNKQDQPKQNKGFKPNFKKKKVQQKSQQTQIIKPLETIVNIQKVEQSSKQTNLIKPKFTFKKRRQQNNSQGRKQDLFKVTEEKVEQTKISQQPHAETKMMRPFMKLRRPGQDKQQSSYNATNNQQASSYSVLKPQQQQQQKVVEEKVQTKQQNFPRRFTLKRRGQQKTNTNQGYSLTIKQEQPKNQQQKPSQNINIYSFGGQVKKTQQTLPPRVRNFGNHRQDPQTNTFVTQQTSNKKIESPPKNIQNGIFKKPQQDIFKAPPKQVQQKTPTNTYVPPPPRQRQGRIKKQKFNLNPTKINNIYNQAQDVTDNVLIASKQQINIQSPKKLKTFQQKQKQPDLNELLGLKGKRTNDDDDLVFQQKVTQKPKPKLKLNVAKQDDFFGFQI